MEELIEQAKSGNKEVFTKLAISMQMELYKIAHMRLSNDDAEDAIQETMIIAFKSIKKLREVQYFKTWIIRILINECNKIYKKKKSLYVNEVPDVAIFNTAIQSRDDFEKVNDNIIFNQMLKKLSYEERTILTLYYMEKYTNKEIGEILKMNENTVKTKISRAKRKIRLMYNKEDEKIG